jgi:hypothetical protein
MLRRSSSLFQSSDCRLWRSLYTAPGAICRFPWRVLTCRRALERRHRAHAPALQRFMVNAILKECLEVHCDFLRRPKIIGWIIGRDPQWVLSFCLRFRCLRFCHHSALQLLHHTSARLMSRFCMLLAPPMNDEQHDERLAAARVIHPAARDRIDSKLTQSIQKCPY